MKRIKLTQKNAPLVLVAVSVIAMISISIFQYGLLPGIAITIVAIGFACAVIFGLYKLMEMLPKG